MSADDDDDDEIPPLIFDFGSGTVKAGFGDEDSPRCCFAPWMGRPRVYGLVQGAESREVYIGDSALYLMYFHPSNLQPLTCPIERRLVTNWDDMERLWKHTFYIELHTSPECHPVLLTESPLNPKAHRERMTKIFFENLQTPALYIFNQAALALYAVGRTMGCVVDSGHHVTHVISIVEGCPIPHATRHLNLGGKDVTDYLMKLLKLHNNNDSEALLESYNHEAGTEWNTKDRRFVSDLKESNGYVALDYEKELHKAESEFETVCTLPEDYHRNTQDNANQTILIGNEVFHCAEILFRPSLLSLGENATNVGMADCTHQSISRCQTDIRQDLYENIVLAGGNTMLKGFPERLSKELKALVESSSSSPTNINVVASPDRQMLAWKGGSILTSLPAFQEQWITREEYIASGPSIVHQRCAPY